MHSIFTTLCMLCMGTLCALSMYSVRTLFNFAFCFFYLSKLFRYLHFTLTLHAICLHSCTHAICLHSCTHAICLHSCTLSLHSPHTLDPLNPHSIPTLHPLYTHSQTLSKHSTRTLQKNSTHTDLLPRRRREKIASGAQSRPR